MKYIAKLVLAMAISITSLIGCDRTSQYSGDGQLVDKGSFAATDRYVLNLGSIDLTQRIMKTFRLVNLPGENFVAGIEIDDHTHNRVHIDKKQLNATVLLELSGVDGKVFLQRKGHLISGLGKCLLLDRKPLYMDREIRALILMRFQIPNTN